MSVNSPALNEQIERFKQMMTVLIALVTLFGAIIAYLQNDASARDDQANRDNQRYALEALGRQTSGDARVNYDYNSAYQNWLELDLLATSAENNDEPQAAARYRTLRDRMLPYSPMLAAPYFNAETGEVDVTRYEADTYLLQVTGLQERFLASSLVKDAWGSKSSTYIIHLTLLAVSLFLFGMSVMVSGVATRWVFATAGLLITGLAVGWAGVTFAQPVVDRRAQGAAIDLFAQGVGLAYQGQWEEAITAFDQALQASPTYARAFAERASAQSALGNYEAAAADYEAARRNGDNSANLAGELAWIYHLLGRFADAVAMNRTALATTPDELWIQYDLALSLLASGQIEEARAEYDKGMRLAAQQVADAKAAGAEPPSYLWWGLDDAAIGLDDLIFVLDGGEGAPGKEQITNVEAVRSAAEDLMRQIKNLSVALEYKGEPPTGGLDAQISPFLIAEPLYNEEGEVIDYQEVETVPFGAQEVAVLFDYVGMKDGLEVLFKVYIDGEEDPSWRLIGPWSAGADGAYLQPLSLAYSENFLLADGDYVVEMYVDSHLAQRGGFSVAAE
jgi:tetratricopeptide (TPR) repeat protein